jgi:hypothetical protein
MARMATVPPRSWCALRLRASLPLALVACVGCAAATVVPPRRVVLLPTDALGVDAADALMLDRALTDALRQRPDLALAEAEPVAEPAPAPECFDDDQCLADLGRTAAVDRVLALRLAGLGDTHVVRARLLDATTGLLVQDLQETVVGERDALAALAPRLLQRLFVPPLRPWYRQWWVWTAAAAVVAGTVTTVAVVAARGDDEDAVHLGDL